MDQSADLKTDFNISKDSGSNTTEDTGSDVESDQDTKIDQASSEFIFDETFNTNTDYKTEASDWTLLNPERSPDVSSDTGSLTIIPAQTQQNAWYEDNQSSLLHRPITGDFVVETSVTVSTIAGGVAPDVGYNSAGFIIRDPASTQGAENWLMYNIGAQSNAVPFGVEVKTTVNSSSVLELFPILGTLTVELRVCRIANSFRYFQRTDNGAWTETLPSTPHLRDDFPATLDVGLQAGSWSAAEVKGSFEWVRAWKPNDCMEDSP